MAIRQDSPETAIRLRSVRPVPLWARVALLFSTWAGGWFLSFGFYCHHWGKPPSGDDLWIAPLATFLFLWPASFVVTVGLLLWWLPTSVSGYLVLSLAILFWPCYITLLVLWFRRGRVRYLALLAAMTVPASIFWHHLTVAALNG
jgi:hypothetical protein